MSPANDAQVSPQPGLVWFPGDVDSGPINLFVGLILPDGPQLLQELLSLLALLAKYV